MQLSILELSRASRMPDGSGGLVINEATTDTLVIKGTLNLPEDLDEIVFSDDLLSLAVTPNDTLLTVNITTFDVPAHIIGSLFDNDDEDASDSADMENIITYLNEGIEPISVDSVYLDLEELVGVDA